jgi:hypothetical protein
VNCIVLVRQLIKHMTGGGFEVVFDWQIKHRLRHGKPVPVAERSKACIYGRSLPGAWVVFRCECCVGCQVEVEADHSSRGVLPIVVRSCV